MKKKVLVGMSGGVDSAVAAYLLQKEGYEVCGVTLRTWEGEDGAESRCCEIDDARRVAWKLGIQYYTLNCTREFAREVVDPFAASYLHGQTPNPCVICNRSIKWDKMLYAAKVMQADYVATGHYAHVLRLDNGRYTVKTARYAAKDQTYMLCRLSQEQLAATLMPLGDYSKDDVRRIAQEAGLPVATLMPLGDYSKDDVRRIAQEAGLPVADKPDSQEICFVTDGHYSDFLETYIRKRETIQEAPAEKTWRVPAPGWFVDEDGNRFYDRYFTYEHKTAQLSDLEANPNEGWWVENSEYDSDNQVYTTTRGVVKIATVSRQNCTLVVLANISNSISTLDGKASSRRLPWKALIRQ